MLISRADILQCMISVYTELPMRFRYNPDTIFSVLMALTPDLSCKPSVPRVVFAVVTT